MMSSHSMEKLFHIFFQYHNFIEEEVNKIAEIYNVNQEPTNFVQSYVRDMKKNPQLE